MTVLGAAVLRESVQVESFEGFVASSLPRLVRFARWVAGPSGDAEDLVQDALERTGMKWRTVGAGSGDPEAYVRRAIVNGNISRWRSRRREHLVDVLPEGPTAERSADDPRHGLVWQAVSSLPRGQRAIVALRFFEDMSVAETARVLGITEGTVKTQSHRALETLRERLGAASETDAAERSADTAWATSPTLVTAPGAIFAVRDGVGARVRRRTTTMAGALTASLAAIFAILVWSPWEGGGQVQPVIPAPSVDGVAPTQDVEPSNATSSTAPTSATPPGSTDSAVTVANTDPDTRSATGEQVILTDVRIGRQDGFDRVVWEFSGAGTPGWVVTYTDNPTRDGSGERVDLPGSATLAVMIDGVGVPEDLSLVYDGPAVLSSADTVAVTDVIPGGIFEGTVDGFIGLSEQQPFRAYLLENPTRMVVDITTARTGASAD